VAILYGLVFELRQGVDDLHFRLQLTDDKVALFLQHLTSLHEAVLSTQEGATSKPNSEPEAKKANDTGCAKAAEDTPMHWAATLSEDRAKENAASLRPTQGGKEARGAENNVKDDPAAAATKQDEKQWGDGTTVVEEEPWPGDLSATWLGHAPGV
jgi:hypothetical protein